ncbi:MAG TPA: prolipoprotein diacylglyceryl transferase [Gammaproteobacteria bacterium]
MNYPHIDPIAVQLGPVAVHWYGLMYLVAFVAAWWLGRREARRLGAPWSERAVEDLIFFGALGVILGGRIGYILFYNFSAFLADPLMLIRIWKGGMSFHGGVIGVMIAMWFFARRYQMRYFAVTDFVVVLAPTGLAAGRIGNFINGELWGKVTTLPWGMVTPDSNGQPLHPSQLYEALLEGGVLFIILWAFTRKPRPVMATSGLFALCYGLFRFAVEFVRMPDAHLGYLALEWVTMGQILSLPLIIVGLILLLFAYRKSAR